MLLLGTQRINERGHLEVGGCDTVELAQRFGTPLYVLDEATFRQNLREYRRAFAQRYPYNEIAYAGKALLCMAVARIVAQEGYDLDVASAGELYTALKAGFPTEKIVFHGNNKSLQELEMAVQHDVGRIVVDNLLEIEMLERVAAQAGKQVTVLIRVTPGIDPHTHRFIRTGQADTKFGLNIRNGYALEGVRRALESPHLRVKGIHCHVGSQLLETEAQERAVKIMVDFMHTLRKQLGYVVEELNIGGGLGIRYIESHQPPTFDEYAERIVQVLTQQLERRNLPYPVLLQEPGRAIVGEAGLTLYTVGAIKEVPIHQPPGTRIYVAVDGGMSDNPRPQLYDAVYTAIVANKANQPANTVVTIAGKHCETDILIRNVAIAPPETGDILAVPSTGAYNYAMSSNYNRFPRPAMVLVHEGRAEVIVERETLDDLLAHDRIPERLQLQQPSPVA